MESSNVVTALAALAHETRLAIYRILVQAGPEGRTVGIIGDAVGIPPASLSFHLKELLHAGLVNVRRSGRFLHYRADFAAMNGLIGYLTENCCGGAPCGPSCAPPGNVEPARNIGAPPAPRTKPTTRKKATS